MNRKQLPGQTWTPVGKPRDRMAICSLCRRRARSRYQHNQTFHNPDRQPATPKET